MLTDIATRKAEEYVSDFQPVKRPKEPDKERRADVLKEAAEEILLDAKQDARGYLDEVVTPYGGE